MQPLIKQMDSPSEKEARCTLAPRALKNTQGFNFLPFKEKFNPSD